VFEDGKECVMKVIHTIDFFKAEDWATLISVEGLAKFFDDMGSEFSGVVDHCTGGVN